MGFRDTLKDFINGIKEDGKDINENSVGAEVARIKVAESGRIEKLEKSDGGASEKGKSALKENVRLDNVETNNSAKKTKKEQPKRMKGRNEDREIGD